MLSMSDADVNTGGFCLSSGVDPAAGFTTVETRMFPVCDKRNDLPVERYAPTEVKGYLGKSMSSNSLQETSGGCKEVQASY